MSLLFPIYLLGALAIGLPLYLHLKRKPPKDSQPVGSLIFWRPAEVTSARRTAKLEDILLLLLRALAILLLVIVFARPFVRSSSSSWLTGGAGARYLILIDSSASMQRKDAWKQAQKLALKELKKLRGNDDVALMTYDRRVKEILSFSEWRKLKSDQRISALKKSITESKPGWSSSHLDRGLLAALDSVREAEATSEKATTKTQIIVISDMQSGSVTELLASKPWPPEIPVSFLRIESDFAGNASIHPVASDDPAAPKVRLTNSDDHNQASFKLTWSTNDVYETHYVAPGKSVVVNSPVGFPPKASLELSGDEIEFDNQVVFPPPKPARPTISLISDSKIEREQSVAFYLSQAMIPTPRLQPTLKLNEIDQADLYIVDGSISAEQGKTIRQQLEKGKSCLFLIDRETAGEGFAQVAGLDSAPIINTRVMDSNFAMFESIDFKHPVIAPFAAPSVRDFSKIKIWKYQELQLPEDATQLMSFEGNAPALFEISVGKGKVYGFTTTWATKDSQLARSTKFIPLLYSLFRESGLRPGAEATFLVGDRLPLQRDFGEGEVSLEGETGKPIDVAAGFIAEKPGLYEFKKDQRVRRYAVNLDPRESDLTPISVNDLSRFGIVSTLPGENQSNAADSSEKNLTPQQASDLELEKRQKLFRWLGLLIAILVLLETLLAGNRRAASNNQPQPAKAT